MQTRDHLRRVEFNYLYRADGKLTNSGTIEGFFHAFGNADEETNDGILHITVAIIELVDGQVVHALPENVKFISF